MVERKIIRIYDHLISVEVKKLKKLITEVIKCQKKKIVRNYNTLNLKLYFR